MKKFLLILACLILNINTVCASINTYERTEDNLRIDSRIEVTSSNKANILATPSVDASEKVYDFADLFTTEEEKQLYLEVMDYINNYEMDLVIVTTNYIHTSDTRNYGMDFYDYNDFGFTNKKNGILLVIDMQNRRYEMVTTGEAILMYDDARVNSILDDMFEDIKNETYYNGCAKFIQKASDYAKKGIPSSNKHSSIDEYGNITTDYPLPWIMITLISAGATLVIMLILVHKNKMVKKATTAKEYLVNDTLKIDSLQDFLIDSNISRVKIDHSSSSSGGGSSTSSGSSGSSHGGGGRSF